MGNPRLPALILAIVAFLGCIGDGAKYVPGRLESQRVVMEAQRVRYKLRIGQERLKHETAVADRIAELRREIVHQDREIADLRATSNAYLVHISTLEGLMRAANIQVPELRLPILRSLREIDAREDDRDFRWRERDEGDAR